MLPLLDALEQARLRGAWSALYRRAQRAAYAHGAASSRLGRRRRRRAGARRRADGVDPLPRPGVVAPRVRVRHDDRVVAELPPPAAWDPRVATELAQRLADVADVEELLADPLADDAADRPLREPVTVILGPDRAPGDASACDALEAAGARVAVLEGPPGTHWHRVLEAVRAAETPLVAIPSPGRTPTPRWLAEVEIAFAAPRVALALGQGLPSSSSEPLTLHEQRRGRVPYAPLGGPADYLVLRASALPQLEAAIAHARHGAMAVAFACAEAVLAEGDLVAHRNVRGLDPSGGAWPAAHEREREKLTAWGALLAGHALAAPGLRGPARLAGATVLGLAAGARRSLRRGRPADLSGRATTSALLRGYAAAFPRREPSRAP